MSVGRGTFVLRYVASADSASPRVVVAKDPDHAAGMELMFSPGAEGGALRRPGDLCVLSSSADSQILVTTIGADLSMREAVTLKLDRIDAETPAAQTKQVALAADPRATTTGRDINPVPLRLTGHVEVDGDVTVGAGEWLGGDDRQIEGFAVQWPRRPANVDISYGCSVKGIGRLPDGVVGEFVGTRNQARGINGVAFSLIGEDAPSYTLTLEAVFSDGSQYGPEEAPVEFRGRTGREHLVGLSVNLTKARQSSEVSRRPAPRLNGSKAPQVNSRQVRVFRAPKSSLQIDQR